MSTSNKATTTDNNYKDATNNLKYNLINFLPSSDAVNTTTIGYSGKNNLINNMIRVDNGIHTPKSCKITAGMKLADMKYKEKMNILNGVNKKTPGLKFKIVKGYFGDNVKYFLDPKYNVPDDRATGIATNFSNLYNSTNNTGLIDTFKTDRWGGHSYSVEWYGVLIPDFTGDWKFGLNSDDASFLWLGDKAINTYNISNCDINNRSLHGMRYKEVSIYLIAGKIYPIRIQFGENYGGHNCIFTIVPPQLPTVDNYYNVLYTFDEEPKYLYYSLTENSPILTKNNLYNCLITDVYSESTNEKLKKTIFSQDSQDSQIEEKVIWKFVTDVSQLPQDGKSRLKIYIDNSEDNINNIDEYKNKIKKGMQLKMVNENDKTIILYETIPDQGMPLSNSEYSYKDAKDYPYHYLSLISRYNNNNNTTNVTLQLTQYSLNWEKNIIKEFFNKTFDDAIVNDEWKAQYELSKNSQHSRLGLDHLGPYWDNNWNNVLEYAPDENTKFTYLISNDYKFKLKINEFGNLVLLYTKKGQPLKATDGTIYTKNDNMYLYELKIDEKMNKIFYTNDNSNNVQQISYNSELLKPTGEYLYLDNFFPSFLSLNRNKNPLNMDLETCKKKCNENPNCDYLYHSDFNGNKFCIFEENKTENILPVSNQRYTNSNTQEINDLKLKFFSQEINIPIKSSLYIKDKKLNMEKIVPEYPQLIFNENRKNINDSSGYSKYSYYSLNNKLFTKDDFVREPINEIKENNQDYYELLFGKQQGFENRSNVIESFNSYSNSDCTYDPSGCTSNILDKKILPLVDTSNEYSKTIDNTINTNRKIETNKEVVNNKWVDLSNNPLYYKIKNEKNKTSLKDGIEEDINELILQENKMYILGAITTATLFITAIMISMN